MDVAPPSPFDANDEFYRRVNKHNWGNQRPNAGAFKPRAGEGLSVDWAELTTPEESVRRGGPADSAPIRLVVLTAGFIWELGLVVKRSEKPTNKAHCDIWGSLLSDGSSAGIELRARLVHGYNRHLGPFDISGEPI